MTLAGPRMSCFPSAENETSVSIIARWEEYQLLAVTQGSQWSSIPCTCSYVDAHSTLVLQRTSLHKAKFCSKALKFQAYGSTYVEYPAIRPIFSVASSHTGLIYSANNMKESLHSKRICSLYEIISFLR